MAAGGALAAVIGQPEVIRGQRLGGQGGIREIGVGVHHCIQPPRFELGSGFGHQVRKLCGGQGAQAGVLHIDGKGQLEVLVRQRSTQGGQLLLRLPGRDGTGVVVAAHRDAQPGTLGVVAGEIGVEVGLAALAAQHPQHHAVDFAAFLDLVPVNAALPAGNVKYGSGHCSAPPLQYSKCLPHKLANSYRCHHWAKS